jgi:hypothetical protein
MYRVVTHPLQFVSGRISGARVINARSSFKTYSVVSRNMKLKALPLHRKCNALREK